MASREIRDWQADVLELVRAQGGSRRAVARSLSLGLNTVGVALMVVVFAQTGGITGAEVAVAGGTATISQTLLTALFGEQAMRSLATDARGTLLERVRADLRRRKRAVHRSPRRDRHTARRGRPTPVGDG